MSMNQVTWLAIRRALLLIIGALDKHFGVESKKNATPSG
jgi:uncharacterized membrane protein